MTTNDITGDKIKSKIPSKEYLDNYDVIFGKPEKKAEEDEDLVPIYDGGSGD